MEEERYSIVEAALSGDLEKVKELVESGADVNARDPTIGDMTALVAATGQGYEDIVRYLVENGADINLGNPLIYAAGDNLSIVKHLVENKADVDAMDGYGFYPTLVALRSNRPDVVKYLIKQGANIYSDSNIGNELILSAPTMDMFSYLADLIYEGKSIDFVRSAIASLGTRYNRRRGAAWARFKHKYMEHLLQKERISQILKNMVSDDLARMIIGHY